jgi:hypothetical protein
MERTNSILAILNQAECRLHVLRNTFPCGIRSIDDATDTKIKSLTAYIAELRAKIGAL